MSEGPDWEGRVGEALALSRRGDRPAARAVLASMWDEAAGDPVRRCAVAHWLADVQEDAAGELVWDLRALAAARQVSDEDARRAGLAGGPAILFPSLHLNLADVHLRLGDRPGASVHLEEGRRSLPALGDDAYARMVGEALDRIARALAAPGAGAHGSDPHLPDRDQGG